MGERLCSQCGRRFSAQPACGFAHAEIQVAGGWSKWMKQMSKSQPERGRRSKKKG